MSFASALPSLSRYIYLPRSFLSALPSLLSVIYIYDFVEEYQHRSDRRDAAMVIYFYTLCMSQYEISGSVNTFFSFGCFIYYPTYRSCQPSPVHDHVHVTMSGGE